MVKVTRGFFYKGEIMRILGIFFVSLFLTTSIFTEARKAIVVGATSGMGRQVAKLLGNNGEYEVGLCGRRTELLESLQQEISTKTYIKQIDVTNTEHTQENFAQLVEQMGGLDLLIVTVSAFMNLDFQDNSLEAKIQNHQKLIDIDVVGTVLLAELGLEVFRKQNSGHLVLFSSIDGLRVAGAAVYSGSKSFILRYGESIRNEMLQKNIPIHVTIIIPGWVNNEKVDYEKIPGTYWVTPTDVAAEQIYDAIKNKEKSAYISKRWKIIAWLLALLPDWLYNAIGGL